MIKECYRDIKVGTRLFCQAPTGIGKTVSTLYPAVRRLGEGVVDRIFYLTGKASIRREALSAMRKMNDAVFYVEMERPKRGKYICTFHLVTREATKLPENEITIRFFKLLEETINKQPAFYLWTHNRWKRTHEEFDRMYKMVNGKAIPREEVTE
jgi:Rad3-related DNA helicase